MRQPSVHVLLSTLKRVLTEHLYTINTPTAQIREASTQTAIEAIIKDLTSCNIDRGTYVVCKTTKDYQLLTGDKAKTQSNKEKLFISVLHSILDAPLEGLVVQNRRYALSHPKYADLMRAQSKAEDVFKLYENAAVQFSRKDVYRFYLTVCIEEARTKKIVIEKDFSKHYQIVVDRLAGEVYFRSKSKQQQQNIKGVEACFVQHLLDRNVRYVFKSEYLPKYQAVLLQTKTQNIHVFDWIDAQFEELAWRKTALSPDDLIGQDALDRFINYSNKEDK